MNDFNTETLKQHAQMILDALNDGRIDEQMIADNKIHNEVFNTDYFIIGYYQADKWIRENFNSTFEAIDIVRQYEVDNFGEFNTEINSEKIANMLSYICGEIVLHNELCNFDDLESLEESLNDYLNN